MTTPPPPSKPTSLLWDVRRQLDGSLVERINTDQLRSLVAAHAVSVEDLARRHPDGPWQQIGTLDDLASTVAGSRQRRRLSTDDDDEFDMTPMIDVTFLLLIFFMVTASFHFQKGLDFPSSEDQTQDSSSDAPAPGIQEFDDRLFVGIDAQDQYSFRTAANPQVAGEAIDSERLGEILEEQSRSERKGKLLIFADDQTSHAAVVKLIDAANNAGILDIGMANVVGANTSVTPAGSVP
ncbi:MAG: biopolymer transporter ExbD [Planctomycetaceae bacterium]|nr:biopolymer transporter ExbD [Planctomycetaceae bacterium]